MSLACFLLPLSCGVLRFLCPALSRPVPCQFRLCPSETATGAAAAAAVGDSSGQRPAASSEGQGRRAHARTCRDVGVLPRVASQFWAGQQTVRSGGPQWRGACGGGADMSDRHTCTVQQRRYAGVRSRSCRSAVAASSPLPAALCPPARRPPLVLCLAFVPLVGSPLCIGVEGGRCAANGWTVSSFTARECTLVPVLPPQRWTNAPRHGQHR